MPAVPAQARRSRPGPRDAVPLTTQHVALFSLVAIYIVFRLNQTEVRIMAKKHSLTGHRSSKTGKFVTERYAKAHPDKTQRESIPNPGRGDTGRGKKN